MIALTLALTVLALGAGGALWAWWRRRYQRDAALREAQEALRRK